MGLLEVPQQPLTQQSLYNNGKEEITNLRLLEVGSGNNIFVTDIQGSRWGSAKFDDAKAYIKMDGSFKFKASDGTVLIDSNDLTGNFINLINSKINTDAQTILAEFTFQDSGALAIKTDANNGVWLSPTGILAKKAGVNTLTITDEGDITFAGTLSGASGTLGTITSGTITGATIQTETSGSGKYPIKLNASSNQIEFLDNATIKAKILLDGSNSLIIDVADNIYFRSGSSSLGQIKSGGLYLPAGKRVQFDSGRYLEDQSSLIYCSGDFVASAGIRADSYSVKPSSTVYPGASGTFTDGSGRTVRVRGGIITNLDE